MSLQPRAAQPRILTRAEGASAVSPDEIARVANELRSGFADLQQRIAQREADGQSIESMRGELRQHATDLATLQDLVARATRPAPANDNAPASREERLSAFGHWLRTGDHTRLVALGAWKPELATRATVGLEGVNPQGGYVVLDNFDAEIDRISRIYSNVRAYARVVRISAGNTYSKPTNKSGTTAYWTGEEGARPETDAIDWALNQINAHEANAIPRYSRLILADAYFDLIGEITRDLGEAFGKLEAAAQVNGDGIGKPEGFMSITKAAQTGVTEVAYGKLGFVKTGHATGWGPSSAAGDNFDVFTNVRTALKTEYHANAAYYMNRVSLGEIILLKDADGRSLWQPSMDAGVPSSMRGYPVRTIEEMDDRAAGAFPVVFGDMASYYTILDRAGIEILQNPYKDTGFVRFESWKRSGGKVMKSEAMKAIKVSA